MIGGRRGRARERGGRDGYGCSGGDEEEGLEGMEVGVLQEPLPVYTRDVVVVEAR